MLLARPLHLALLTSYFTALLLTAGPHGLILATMTEHNSGGNESKCTPAELLLKVVLAGTLSHYETRGMIDDKQLEQMLIAGKKIVLKTRHEMEVRYV